MNIDEIKALEHRLTDAGCYNGAIDGVASSALDAAIKACPTNGRSSASRSACTRRRRSGLSVPMRPAGCSQRGPPTTPCGCGRCPTASFSGSYVCRLATATPAIYATALSPDGRWLAAGGSDAALEKLGKHSVTIVDLSDGALRRFGAFEDAISRVTFSPDGRRLAVGLDGTSGLRVLDRATGAELLADYDYGGGVHGLARSRPRFPACACARAAVTACGNSSDLVREKPPNRTRGRRKRNQEDCRPLGSDLACGRAGLRGNEPRLAGHDRPARATAHAGRNLRGHAQVRQRQRGDRQPAGSPTAPPSRKPTASSLA